MAAKRKSGSGSRESEAETKLSRLLQTENALEVMLKEARQEAAAILEAAEVETADLSKAFEREIEKENGGLRERVAAERDQVISSIRNKAEQETERLDGFDEATIRDAARHVLALLLSTDDSRGSH
jgi:hypothetical protein